MLVVLVAICILMQQANSIESSDVQLTLAPVVIPTNLEGDELQCPANAIREEAKQNITSSVQMLLRSILQDRGNGLFTVTECGQGLWKQVAFLDMSDPSTECPSNWRLFSRDNVRACGRTASGVGSCSQEFFPVTGANNTQLEYSKVCGRIIGYLYATAAPFSLSNTSIDEPYVDGVSVTYGRPRMHIWTFGAAAVDYPFNPHACPCAKSGAPHAPVPRFVGNHYFCESGNRHGQQYAFFPNDPLWDGQDCPRGNCCSFNNPPWFSVDLDSPTTDDIEVRICADQDTNDEDSPIGLLELYVQ